MEDRPLSSVSVRLNPFKGLAGPSGNEVPWSPYCRILDSRPVFTLDPLFHAGCYYVQDSSAMYVGHIFRKALRILGKRSGLRVLDLCASPGGKSTDLSTSLREWCGRDFTLVCNEVMKARVGTLVDNIEVWGEDNAVVTSCDSGAFAAMGGWFDIIVADVPCSGEGMFRKDERAEEQFGEDTVRLCAARQKRILADVWPALREGGIIVYSTCTYQQSENDGNLQWICSHLGAEPVRAEDEFPQFGVQLTEYGNLLVAGTVPGEGQWVGAAVKTSRSAAAKHGPEILHPLRNGLSKGISKGGKLIPDASLPLSMDFDRSAWNCVDVDLRTALKYLHRDTIVIDGPRGYNAVCYEGHPLGFVNNLGTRCNNLLPKGRRILMDVE